MSFEDSDRDQYGNQRSSMYTSDQARYAGVNSNDSPEVARHKIANRQKYDDMWKWDASASKSKSGTGSAMYHPPSNGEGLSLKAILIGIVCFFLVLGMPAILAVAWYAKDEFFKFGTEAWVDAVTARAAKKRVDAFTDFSQLSDWPSRVQETFRKKEATPLEVLLDDIPAKLKTLSPARKEELGAQIWFKISSKGAQAPHYLQEVQTKPHRVESPWLRAGSLSVYFLRQECNKGIEIACLDAAKSIAGLLWNGTGAFDDKAINELALEQLPTTGSLSKSDSIEALRKKIMGWRK